MNRLISDNIHLRAIEPEDLQLLYDWENNTEIWELGNTTQPFSIYTLKRYLETCHLDIFENKQLRMVIQTNKTKRPVGLIDLFDFDPFNSRVGIGILINENKDRKQGFAGEALSLVCTYISEILLINQAYCNISEDNKASIQLFEKFGFEQNGVKKQWTKRRNKYIDELFFQKIF
ncbi:MAG: GNAT family N-acetyltransferase [Marinifilaceae bacterium]|jgi:diamine N-acetyltransferase|nr:GNAT family N-acetyltransferase [Marinifilaceae bacterium]